MATTGSVNNSSGSTSTSKPSSQSSTDRLQELNVDQFLKLMIAELQNQDPLNPMDNAQMIEQVSQIRSVAATDKLSQTLTNVQLGQALSSASGLIGKEISGLTKAGDEVNGKVTSVSVVDGIPKLHVGDDTVDLTNIREITTAAG